MFSTDYNYVIIPIITVIFAQITKFVVESFIYKKINLIRLLDGSGGMPSSHSAFVFSLVTVIGIGEGITTSIFALSFVFACITAYDAMGIRYETGKQAEAINQIVDELNIETQFSELKEKIGHKPIEVICGIVFGIITSIILINII